MEILSSAAEMRKWSLAKRALGQRIGLVPTMGSLHDGHLSLIDTAKKQSDLVVVSIFVNPPQFDRASDLETYPRNTERDLELCRQRGVAAVYLPDAPGMYPDGYATWVTVERLGDFLCGATRLGHFRGVTTVVVKLFHAVTPHLAVFGRKDAQQARIVERMTSDLDFGVAIVLGDIVREPDGLAMSSRNARLEPELRKQAPAIHQGLLAARERWAKGERSSSKLRETVTSHLKRHAPDARVDYIEVVDWATLSPVDTVHGDVLLATAVFFDEVRLIDNELLLEER
ncbi:MAG: pantoate--beta-alanine ligase [bacterium]